MAECFAAALCNLTAPDIQSLSSGATCHIVSQSCILHVNFEFPLLLRTNTPCRMTVYSNVRDFDVRYVRIGAKQSWGSILYTVLLYRGPKFILSLLNTRKLSVQFNTKADISPLAGLSSSRCSANHCVWIQLVGHQRVPLRADLYSLWRLFHKIRTAITTHTHTHTHTHTEPFFPRKSQSVVPKRSVTRIYPRDRNDPGSYSNLRRAAVHFGNYMTYSVVNTDIQRCLTLFWRQTDSIPHLPPHQPPPQPRNQR